MLGMAAFPRYGLNYRIYRTPWAPWAFVTKVAHTVLTLRVGSTIPLFIQWTQNLCGKFASLCACLTLLSPHLLNVCNLQRSRGLIEYQLCYYLAEIWILFITLALG